MAYLDDLTEYTYARSVYYRPLTKAVGWLGRGHDFERSVPTEALLDLVWQYCKVSVAQTRGFHTCEFCPPSFSPRAERNGETLLLGTSEIRAFGEGGIIYASPTLIYHYILVHHYTPPDEFIRSLQQGPKPPSSEYFERLKILGLSWNETSSPAESISLESH